MVELRGRLDVAGAIAAGVTGKISVFLDGDAVKCATGFDTWGGWVEHYQLDDRGAPLVRDDTLVVARRVGIVRAVIRGATGLELEMLARAGCGWG